MKVFAAIAILFAAALLIAWATSRRAPPQRVCRRCEEVVRVGIRTRGSAFIDVVLWFAFLFSLFFGLWPLFLVIALVHSGWRLSTRHWVCVRCQQPDVVPITSVAGRRIVATRSDPLLAPVHAPAAEELELSDDDRAAAERAIAELARLKAKP